MINVVISLNMMKTPIEVDESTTTVAKALDDAGFDVNCNWSLDGDMVTGTMMHKTFLELGRNDDTAKYFLSSIQKTDSAR